MAVTENDNAFELIEGARGSSGHREFFVDGFDEAVASNDIPAMNAAFPGASELCVVRRRAFRKIATSEPGAPVCKAVVEYSTPREGEAGFEYPEEPDDQALISETLTTEINTIKAINAFQAGATEKLISEIDYRYSVLIYRRTLLFASDRTDDLLPFLDSINEFEASVGDNIAFAGESMALWFAGLNVGVEFANVGQGYEKIWRTALEFRKRPAATWDKEWINPEPWLNRAGFVQVYGDAHPFQPTGPHKRGDIVMQPATKPVDDYVLDESKIGWLSVAGHASGIAYTTDKYRGGFKMADWEALSSII